MSVSLASSERGTFTLISRMDNETTSTMSRLLAPRFFIDLLGAMSESSRPSTVCIICFFTTAKICSFVISAPSTFSRSLPGEHCRMGKAKRCHHPTRVVSTEAKLPQAALRSHAYQRPHDSETLVSGTNHSGAPRSGEAALRTQALVSDH